jgi:hypothetical protein
VILSAGHSHRRSITLLTWISSALEHATKRKTHGGELVQCAIISEKPVITVIIEKQSNFALINLE